MKPESDSGAVAAVRELVVEMSPLGISEVAPDTALVEELGFDSLGLVELLVVIEDRLGLPPLEEQTLTGIERIADLEALVAAERDRASIQ
jgi:acyl carrier protein